MAHHKIIRKPLGGATFVPNMASGSGGDELWVVSDDGAVHYKLFGYDDWREAAPIPGTRRAVEVENGWEEGTGDEVHPRPLDEVMREAVAAERQRRLGP